MWFVSTLLRKLTTNITILISEYNLLTYPINSMNLLLQTPML